ncbi:hypothetical protein AO382_0945 [Moraxella catarrhalis]|uniref:Uncharacterized protein n=1 Tax=Moraxella catarrhalis TaxID=480 RepID=A0A7Z0UYZ7_MORCA|nr:hypothetical protein AO382_0945 [Moraxella catarrhalis]
MFIAKAIKILALTTNKINSLGNICHDYSRFKLVLMTNFNHLITFENKSKYQSKSQKISPIRTIFLYFRLEL